MKFNKKGMLTLSLFVLTFSSNIFAISPPNAKIAVKGDIKPPTCTINGLGSSDIIFDYGRIAPGLIPKTNIYNYPNSMGRNTVTITCDAQTYLTFVPTDTYQDTELVQPNLDNEMFFHLVDKNDSTKSVGATTFLADNMLIDGKKSFISISNEAPKREYILTLHKGATHGWTTEQQEFVNKSDLKLASGKIFQTDFIQANVGKTYIQSRDTLEKKGIDISNGLDFVGEAVLTFNFGI